MKEKFSKKTMLMDALKQALAKLSFKTQLANPVMFVVYLGAMMTTLLYVLTFWGIGDTSSWFTLAIAMILWATVLFANFAEAIAEGRGRAQADSLKSARKEVYAKRVKSKEELTLFEMVNSTNLKRGDLVYVVAGEQVPMDGDVIFGAASVDESAITGESAPVIRESGGDRSAVTGGTTVVSDELVIQVTAESGESFLDKMIAMVEGSARKKNTK